MFHKCIADGKKLFLLDFKFGMGNKELGLPHTVIGGHRQGFWVKMRVPTQGLMSGRLPANLYSVVVLFEVHQSFRRFSSSLFTRAEALEITAKVTANMACSSSLVHLQFVLLLLNIMHFGVTCILGFCSSCKQCIDLSLPFKT